MCTVEDFVEHSAGVRTNDEVNHATGDWKVWTKEARRRVAREVLSEILGFRPDLFAKEKTVQLTPGTCVQSLCDQGCTRVLDIISVDGIDCNKVEQEADENRRSLDYLSCYLPACKTTLDCNTTDKDWGGYDPGRYTINENQPCQVRFTNPPPAGRTVPARVMCVPRDPLSGTLPELVCTEHFAMVIDGMMWRLHLIDHEDGTSVDIADRYYQAWVAAVKLKFDVDYALLENNFLLTKRRVDDRP